MILFLMAQGEMPPLMPHPHMGGHLFMNAPPPLMGQVSWSVGCGLGL